MEGKRALSWFSSACMTQFDKAKAQQFFSTQLMPATVKLNQLFLGPFQKISEKRSVENVQTLENYIDLLRFESNVTPQSKKLQN